jgi:hypothetical protein
LRGIEGVSIPNKSKFPPIRINPLQSIWIENNRTSPEVEIEAFGAEASKHQAETKAGSSEPAKVKSLETKEIEAAEQILAKETGTTAPEAFSEAFNYILRHASGKELTEKEKQEATLIFNGSGEEDFLYCLPDSKEISVCREMSKSFGFPTLEDGLSVLSKNELADSLAYNSLKVKK